MKKYLVVAILAASVAFITPGFSAQINVAKDCEKKCESDKSKCQMKAGKDNKKIHQCLVDQVACKKACNAKK